MLIFSVGSQATVGTRIIETLVGAAAGASRRLPFARYGCSLRKEAVGELSRQMADLLGQMAEGLAVAPDPRRAAEWLDRTRALRGEIERVDDALAEAEAERPGESACWFGDLGPRDGVDTLERAATDVRVLARSVADSARIDSEHSPVKEAETRARLAAVIAELSAAARAYGQLLEAQLVSPQHAAFAAEPITEALEDHLEAGPAAAGPARRPALHQPGRTAGGMAAARRDPRPRGPAALRTGALAPARAGPRQGAAAGPAAEGAARTAGPAPERTAPQRVAPGSGRADMPAATPTAHAPTADSWNRAAAEAEPEHYADTGQADRVPGQGQAEPGQAASRWARRASAARRAHGARCRGSRARSA